MHSASSFAAAAAALPVPPAASSSSSSANSSSMSALTNLSAAVQKAMAAIGVALSDGWTSEALQMEIHEGAIPEVHTYLNSNAAAAASSAPIPPAIVDAARDRVWQRMMLSSLLSAGARRLPPNFASLSAPFVLAGTHVVQLLECADIAHSHAELAERPQRDDRMWKMQITDGVQAVVACERRKCPELTHQLMKPGVKLALCNVPVRHGMLMLQPGNVMMLGGGIPQEDEQMADGAGQMQQQQESKEKEQEEKKQMMQPAAAPPARILPPSAAPAAAASSAAAVLGRPLSSASAPPQLQQQPSIWQPRSQQPASSTGAAAAAASSSSLPSAAQPFRPQLVAPLPLPAHGGLPLPMDDGDDAMFEDEEAMQALQEQEAEAAERGRRMQQQQQQQQAPQQPPQPLFTSANLLSPSPAGMEDAAMDAPPDRPSSRPSSRPPSSSQPLSQSMPSLEGPPSILEFVSPVIRQQSVQQEPTPSSRSESTAAASLSASSIPTLAAMSSMLTPPSSAVSNTAVAASSPAMAGSVRSSPASGLSVKGALAAGAAAAAGSSPASAKSSSPSTAAGRSRSTASPGIKSESGSAGGGTLDSFVIRGQAKSTSGGGSRDSSPSSDDSCVMISSTSTSSRSGTAARSRATIKSEAAQSANLIPLTAPTKTKKEIAAAHDDEDDFLEDVPSAVVAPVAPAAPAAAAAAAASTPIPTLAPLLPLLPSPAAVPPEVSPAALARGLEVSRSAVSRLFPSHDPVCSILRPTFDMLPYTYLHLLLPLAKFLERPLQVLVEARSNGVLGIKLESFFLEIVLQDEWSDMKVRFAPAYMTKFLGHTAQQVAHMDDVTKEPLLDLIQQRIEWPVGMVQLLLQPQSVAPDKASWVPGKEPQIMDMRATTEADRQELNKRKPQMNEPAFTLNDE